MKKDDFFKGIYDDFFGIGKIEKENEKLRNDIKNLKGIDIEETEANIPSIELSQENREGQAVTTIDKDKFMEDILKKIDELYIEEDSKNTLKKIVEYIRKYNEKIEKQFISFNMNIHANNKETFEGVLRVLNDSINFFQYLPNGDIGIISCYDIQNAEDIAKIYSSDNNIIAFNNFNGLYSKDLNDKAKIINKIEECISENENKYLTILYAQNKDELNDLFLSSDKLKNEFAEFNIIGRTPDVQEAYNEILDILNKNSTVTEDIQIKLLDYISNTLPKTESNYPDYRDSLVQKISFNKQVPDYEQNKSIDEIFEELDSLVGLEKVKKMLRELVDLISLKEKSKDILNIKSINLHMVFLGNPGTGKTTVARIVSKILYNLKYIKQDKLLEVTSKDLVAEYVGQTSIKTASTADNVVYDENTGHYSGDLIITVDKPLIVRNGAWYKLSNYNSDSTVTADELSTYGLVHIYQLSKTTINDETEIRLINAAAILDTININDIAGGSIIDMGYEAGHIDYANGTKNYGIGINSSDNYVNLPPRAISLFETVVDHLKDPKVTYNYRGILGTLPPMNSGVDASIYQNMQNTQGIYTDNMYIGDAGQFIAFYEDENGNKQLKIKANQIVYEVTDPEPGQNPWQDIADIAAEGVPGPAGPAGEDAITVRIESSAGEVFLNKQITTTLTCTVIKGGNTDITNQVTRFNWIKKNADGTVDTSWSRPLAGNTIVISEADVTSKAIFICEVEF